MRCWLFMFPTVFTIYHGVIDPKDKDGRERGKSGWYPGYKKHSENNIARHHSKVENHRSIFKFKFKLKLNLMFMFVIHVHVYVYFHFYFIFCSCSCSWLRLCLVYINYVPFCLFVCYVYKFMFMLVSSL